MKSIPIISLILFNVFCTTGNSTNYDEEINSDSYGYLARLPKEIRIIVYSKLDHPFDFNALSRTSKGLYRDIMPFIKAFCPEPSTVESFFKKHVQEYNRLPSVFFSSNVTETGNFTLKFKICYEGDSAYLLSLKDRQFFHKESLSRSVSAIKNFDLGKVSSFNKQNLQGDLRIGCMNFYGSVNVPRHEEFLFITTFSPRPRIGSLDTQTDLYDYLRENNFLRERLSYVEQVESKVDESSDFCQSKLTYNATYPAISLLESDEIANYKNISGTHVNENALYKSDLYKFQLTLLKPLTIKVNEKDYSEHYEILTFSFFDSDVQHKGKPFKNWSELLKGVILTFQPPHETFPAELYYYRGPEPFGGMISIGIKAVLKQKHL